MHNLLLLQRSHHRPTTQLKEALRSLGSEQGPIHLLQNRKFPGIDPHPGSEPGNRYDRKILYGPPSLAGGLALCRERAG